MFAGDSFGELALLHDMKRAATIICKGTAEFLTVDKPDFDMVHIYYCAIYTLQTDKINRCSDNHFLLVNIGFEKRSSTGMGGKNNLAEVTALFPKLHIQRVGTTEYKS